jgi:galactokinase
MSGERARLRARLVQAFQSTFGRDPDVLVQAPGRVNLIGEHTDYNAGYVLPAAIDRKVRIAAARRADGEVRLFSRNFNASATFELGQIEYSSEASWSNYVRGVALMLQEAGYALGGIDAVIEGDVPMGAGLSSSAAIEVASAFTFRHLNELSLDLVELAKLCQRAEQHVVGVQVGIMDQFIAALGQRHQALLIDCRTLTYEPVLLPAQGVRVVVGDTNVRRGLVESEYNVRRKQSEQATAFLAQFLPGVRALRDVSVSEFEMLKHRLPDVLRRRAEHVIYENERVLQAVTILRAGDLEAFGKLMYASHESLRYLYDVSTPELNAMVELARRVPGTLGSRMTGAGFGGSTVSLVRDDAVDRFVQSVATGYRQRTSIEPAMYVCTIEDGVGEI